MSISFLKQKVMRRVLYALAPVLLTGIYYFGWRVLAVVLTAIVFGVATEWVFKRKSGGKVTEAVLVTAVLYALTLPPRTPLWVVAVGIIFGVTFGKEVFGGFGRNVFNPALVGRAFVYVSFAKYLTAQWSAPASGFPGGFARFTTEPIDVLSSSTPMLIFRDSGVTTAYADLFLGKISGSIGETSALVILLAGLYLLYTKTAARETVLSVFAGFLALSVPLYYAGVSAVPDPLFGLLSGGLFFGAFFMATDPISSPKTKTGRVLYGLLIGMVTVIIRAFALFPGAIMFAVLIGNTFAPIIDEGVKATKAARKARQEVRADA